MDAYCYHDSLAELYLRSEDFQSAREQWTLGELSAKSAGNEKYVKKCAAAITRAQEAERIFSQTVRDLQKSLASTCSPKAKAALLLQLLRKYLHAGEEDKAQEIYEQTCVLTESHHLHQEYIDLMLLVADCGWDEGNGSRLNAIKGYAMAIIKAISVDSVTCGRVWAHIILRLTDRKHSPSGKEMERLIGEFQASLSSQTPPKKAIEDLLISPFRIVGKLLPYVGNPLLLARQQQALGDDFKEKTLLSSLEDD